MALGIGFILLTTFFTALQDALIKYASADAALWQLYILRSLFLIPALLLIAFMWDDGAATWRQSLRPWPMLRAVLFVLMYFSMYAAIPVLPLSAIAAGSEVPDLQTIIGILMIAGAGLLVVRN